MNLNILHTNDIHSHIGNLGKIIKYANDVKTNCETILIDCGDMITGSVYYQVFKGEVIANYVNTIDYDIMNFGNHEFGIGEDALLKHINRISDKYISTNSNMNSLCQSKICSHKIINKANMNICFLGVVGEDVSLLVTDTSNIKFTNIIQSIKNELKHLYMDGIDQIILLSHCGLRVDRELAEQIDELDVIIGSHTHNALEEELVINGCKIVQAGSEGNYIGNIEFEDGQFKQYNLVHVNDLEATDEVFTKRLNEYLNKVDDLKREKLFTSKILLSNERDVLSAGTAPLGKLISDSLLYIAKENNYNVDCSIVVGRGLRATLNPGPVSKYDIYNLLPFGNDVYIVEVLGYDLATNFKPEFNMYPQVSNINCDNPQDVYLLDYNGNRKEITLHKHYQIAIFGNERDGTNNLWGVKRGRIIANLGNEINGVCSYLKQVT